MIENSGRLEDWIYNSNSGRIRGYVHEHLTNGKPGVWISTRQLFFQVRENISDSYEGRLPRKGDIIRTNSSILVLGNPRE